jgi:hypothetical protein
MSTGSHLESKIAAACDHLARLREELHGEPPPPAGRAAELREEIDRVKERQAGLQEAYDSAWERSFGPADMRLDPDTGTIRVVQANRMGGGRGGSISPTDPRYQDALAEINSRQRLDRLVAELAFAAWGWRGAVRIGYYGHGANQTARVTDGGRTLTVRVAELMEGA